MSIAKSHRITVLFLALNALVALLGACGKIPTPVPEATPIVVPPTETEPTPANPTTPPLPDPSDPPLPHPTATPVPPCLDAASFAGDITIPDNTSFTPDTPFVKTWRLLNAGTCTWTAEYSLVFANGDRLGGAAAIPLPGTVRPGETVDLSVALTAPHTAGSYTGRWLLRNASGTAFGISQSADGTFLVRIVVNTLTPTPVVPPTVPVITGWKGEYFDTTDLDLARLPVLVRDDAEIDFNWYDGPPAAGLPADAFSVRWTRRITFAEGTYRFHLLVDDGAFLTIDDEIVIDAWKDGHVREVYADYTLDGGAHDVRLEYYDQAGHARIRFWYEKIGAYMPDWKGEYYTNMELRGEPALVQNEGELDFDWGLGSAAAGLPVDHWSARWSRRIDFTFGTYMFHAQADNGIRVYLDGQLIIDGWYSDGQEVFSYGAVLEGSHTLVVEYYENEGSALARLWWE